MYNSYVRYTLLETNKLVCLFSSFFILNEWALVNTSSHNHFQYDTFNVQGRINTDGPWLGLCSIYDIKIKQRWVGQ